MTSSFATILAYNSMAANEDETILTFRAILLLQPLTFLKLN